MSADRQTSWRLWWARWRTWLVPAAVFLAIALPHLSDGDWERTDSGRYAAIGLQAWRTGSLWSLEGEPGRAYFNKPPLVFWVHGLALHAFGVGPMSARLPTVLAALGCVLATVGIARSLATRGAALWTGLILALSYEFIRRTREISLDMWQLLFMLLAVWMLAAAVGRVDRARRAWLGIAAGVPLGLALMCKPLVALAALPMLAIWLVWIGQARRVAWLGGAGAVAVLVAAPWHLSMAAIYGAEFTGQYFGAEVALRAAGANPDDAGNPPWFYVMQILTAHWPWLVLVVLAGAAMVRGRGLSRAGRLERFAVVWVLAWLVLLTVFADRRDRYALPLYPGLAMLGALWLSRWAWPRLRVTSRVGVTWAAPAAIAAGVALAASPIQTLRPANPQWPELYAWLESRGSPEVWQGGSDLAAGSRLYLRFGRWPRPTRDRAGRLMHDAATAPPPGALVFYHRSAGHRPGPNEVVEFTSGDLTVTRLGPGGWQPRKTN